MQQAARSPRPKAKLLKRHHGSKVCISNRVRATTTTTSKPVECVCGTAYWNWTADRRSTSYSALLAAHSAVLMRMNAVKTRKKDGFWMGGWMDDGKKNPFTAIIIPLLQMSELALIIVFCSAEHNHSEFLPPKLTGEAAAAAMKCLLLSLFVWRPDGRRMCHVRSSFLLFSETVLFGRNGRRFRYGGGRRRNHSPSHLVRSNKRDLGTDMSSKLSRRRRERRRS